MLTKSDVAFAESCRIILAKNFFDEPPDTIDVQALMRCARRAIRHSVINNINNPVIMPIGRKEKDMIYFNDVGKHILDLIFTEKAPFFSWYSKVRQTYEVVERVK